MCYHYTLRKTAPEIVAATGAAWDEGNFEPIFHSNGFDFPGMPVLTVEKPETIQRYHWGLIPHWVSSLAGADKLRTQTLNARSETIWEKPAFRSYTQNRCLVLADGFFEWMEFKKKKYPHFVHRKNDGLFAFAGLYAHWTDKETGEVFPTFTLMTTDANPLLAKIHNTKKRMPVLLRPEEWKHWLAPNLSKEATTQLLQPSDDSDLEGYPISRLITTRGANTNVPEIVAPHHYEELEVA